MTEEQKSSVSEISRTFIEEDQSSDSENSLSSDGLEIDISASPSSKNEISFEEKSVLENIEEEIERQYDEKAAKSNLSSVNVKNILKHVLTNEHVWAMVRNTTGENIADDEHAFYEPKLTRAKAKELFKNQNVSPPIPWATTVPDSEVHILINEELAEDSDDDEYIPGEEESEDEKESCPPSDADSQPATPATPTSTHDNSTQWTEDGVFKIPPTTSIPKTPNKDIEIETNENIALRTRSKLSLSDTPLETIEEAFIPPDITTDMYDLECDDEDWKDFLKKFTRPLDEAVTGTQEDDDEADPEYNVLSDEEIDKLDKEELRQDRGVKITKKELNTLVAELFDFAEIFSNEKDSEADKENIDTNQNNQENFPQPDQSFTDVPNVNFTENTAQNFPQTVENFPEQPSQNFNNAAQPEVIEGVLEFKSKEITLEQLMLFEQQMRQHVQMLTQNYILSYKHIYLDHLSSKFKDMLFSLDELSKYRVKSAFKAYNLSPSIDFIKDWDEMIASDSKEVREMLCYVAKVAKEFLEYDAKNKEYIVTFPPLLMKKVAASSAFIYPSLLPKVPFRYSTKNLVRNFYVKSENELIALGLEQFREYLKDKPLYRVKNGQVSNRDVCMYICEYMLPNRDPKKLHWYIQRLRYSKKPNPINYYYKHGKAPTTINYVCSLEQFGVLPPKMRPPENLPYQWKNFLYPEPETIPAKPAVTLPVPKPKRVTKPPAYKKQPKKTKVNITQPTNLTPILPNPNPNLAPILIINNLAPATKINEVNKHVGNKNWTTINSAKKGISSRRKNLVLPQIEEIFIKTEDYYISTDKNKFPATSSICEPPPVSTTHQIQRFNPELLNLKFNSSIFQKIKDIDMLPSMPFLLTPVKENRQAIDEEVVEVDEDPLKIVSPGGSGIFKKEKVQKETPKTSEDKESIEKDTKKDDEEELNALMVASSTMQQKNRRLQPNLTKKAKQLREYNASLAMLCPEDPKISEEKAKNFAQAYYDKVQERLESDSPIEYQNFIEILSEHDETKSTVSDLYGKVSSILSPKHPDLCEEFLTFLSTEQAEQIGKLVPHFMMTNMSLFLRKLELYYSQQPAQLRKIYNSLIELAGISDITMDKVKSTILPLLKGNSFLIDWFLQMFPKEAPPENLMTDWEQVNCGEEESNNDNKIFETLSLPEVEDPYGGPNCICKCHKIDDEMYKTRRRHCIPCGTKFLQGRVYVQTRKGLRLANISFNSSNPDHIKRLSVKPTKRQKRKSETSPSKISPTKEDEPRNESEEDNLENNPKKQKTSKVSTSTPSKTRKKPTQKQLKNKNPKTKPQKKITKAPVESLEESSQDTLEESEDSAEEIETENSEDSNSLPELDKRDQGWTQEEDRAILQTIKDNGESEEVYAEIQKLIPNRSVEEIRKRFEKLMSLWKIFSSDDVS